MGLSSRQKAAFYGFLNLVSASGIVSAALRSRRAAAGRGMGMQAGRGGAARTPRAHAAVCSVLRVAHCMELHTTWCCSAHGCTCARHVHARVRAFPQVFANKFVFQDIDFPFPFALTWIHTGFTLIGMGLLARLKWFEPKRLPASKLFPLAVAYCGYIVLGNASLNLNTVGFYQIMKARGGRVAPQRGRTHACLLHTCARTHACAHAQIAVAPTVIALELLLFRRLPGRRVMLAVLVVCMGIGVATVGDKQVGRVAA